MQAQAKISLEPSNSDLKRILENKIKDKIQNFDVESDHKEKFIEMNNNCAFEKLQHKLSKKSKHLSEAKETLKLSEKTKMSCWKQMNP